MNPSRLEGRPETIRDARRRRHIHKRAGILPKQHVVRQPMALTRQGIHRHHHIEVPIPLHIVEGHA